MDAGGLKDTDFFGLTGALAVALLRV